jgi:hypothetical protein
MADGNANGEPAHPRREKLTSQQKIEEIHSLKKASVQPFKKLKTLYATRRSSHASNAQMQ